MIAARYGLAIWIKMMPLLAIDVLVFVLQKIACSQAEHISGNFYWALAGRPLLWLALMLALLQLYLWTRILKTVDLALAYPISSLSSPMTMLASQLLLYEHLQWRVWTGALLIILGVICIGSERTPDACNDDRASTMDTPEPERTADCLVQK